jgi:hypothetical protein
MTGEIAFLRARADALFAKLESGLTSYDLFALTVVVMLIGHVGYYLVPDALWLRVPDRILVPVFLVGAGYNAGRKSGFSLWVGAIMLDVANRLLLRQVDVNILGTIIFVRAVLPWLMPRLLKSRELFWGFNVACVLAFPVTNVFFEYGTLAFVMAIAGWLRQNEDEVPPDIVKTPEFFACAYIGYLMCSVTGFKFSPLQMLIVAAGGTIVMRLLYDLRVLILNAVRQKRRDPVQAVCAFLGHKSLEIYVVHVIFFDMLLYYAFHIMK